MGYALFHSFQQLEQICQPDGPGKLLAFEGDRIGFTNQGDNDLLRISPRIGDELLSGLTIRRHQDEVRGSRIAHAPARLHFAVRDDRDHDGFESLHIRGGQAHLTDEQLPHRDSAPIQAAASIVCMAARDSVMARPMLTDLR